MLPLTTNVKEAFAQGQDEEQNFIQNLAMFLCTFLKVHGSLVEKPELNEVLLKVHMIIYNYEIIVIITISSAPSYLASPLLNLQTA